MQKTLRLAGLSAAAMMVLVSGACPATAASNDLRPPAQVSCIHLPVALSTTEAKGLFKVVWTTRLERGPYISEREDAEGTYYRAPPGGIHVSQPNPKDKLAAPVNAYTSDGGIFVPRDAAAPARLYHYLQNEAAPVTVPPDGADCSSTTVVRDPATKGVSVAAYAAAFGAAGAAGGYAAREAAPNSSVSHGRAAGIGAAGGLISGVIVGAMINMEVGKLAPLKVKLEPQFSEELNKAARAAVPIKEQQ